MNMLTFLLCSNHILLYIQEPKARKKAIKWDGQIHIGRKNMVKVSKHIHTRTVCETIKMVAYNAALTHFHSHVIRKVFIFDVPVQVVKMDTSVTKHAHKFSWKRKPYFS